jgi:hypothetical protein
VPAPMLFDSTVFQGTKSTVPVIPACFQRESRGNLGWTPEKNIRGDAFSSSVGERKLMPRFGGKIVLLGDFYLTRSGRIAFIEEF